MIIDTHSHHVPEAMLDDLVSGRASFPSVELLAEDGRYRLAFAGGRPTRPVMSGLRAVEPRLAWMSGQAVDYQVCAGWLDSFGYGIPAEEGLAWSRFVNEHLARARRATMRVSCRWPRCLCRTARPPPGRWRRRSGRGFPAP